MVRCCEAVLVAAFHLLHHFPYPFKFEESYGILNIKKKVNNKRIKKIILFPSFPKGWCRQYFYIQKWHKFPNKSDRFYALVNSEINPIYIVLHFFHETPKLPLTFLFKDYKERRISLRQLMVLEILWLCRVMQI